MLRFGPLELASNLCLSPLAGYTDLAFRRIVRSCGGLGLATTEVVSACAVVRHNARTPQFTRSAEDDKPLAVQIDGGRAAELAEAARILEATGDFAAIDINMGCPVPRLTDQGGGAAWTCSPARAAEAVAAVVAAVRIPVTVKMRLGWDDGSITAPELARVCAGAGAAGVFVHGRTREQGFSGEVRLAGIAAVVRAMEGTGVPVVGNGDVVSPEAARRMLDETGCAGVSIGRAALTDPWIFARTRAALDGVPGPVPSFEDRVEIVRRHWALLRAQDPERRAVLRFRKAAVWYGPALRTAKEYRRRANLVDSVEDVARLLDDLAAGRLRARRPLGAKDEPRVPVPSGPIAKW